MDGFDDPGPPTNVDPQAGPSSVAARVPAHLCLLSVIRGLASAVIFEFPCDYACRADLVLAADELASLVILDARPWSEFELELAYDEADVYVRMSAERGDPERPLVIEDLSDRLLSATVESYDLRADARHVVAVLQRPLRS